MQFRKGWEESAVIAGGSCQTPVRGQSRLVAAGG